MHPELIKLPFLDVTVKSYGFMMVVGFLTAVWIIRRLSRDITPDPQYITNAALYSLIGGVVGARLFFVLHYFDSFRGDWLSVFYIWKGGLELLGGVILAISIIFLYLVYHKLPIRRYLDILGIGLMAALVFGRIGCFLNGCCYGQPTDLPWGVRFPYGSFAYDSQIRPDPGRGRAEPQLKLPDEYFNGIRHDGLPHLKPLDELTGAQRLAVTAGPYRCLRVHPSQLYSSVLAACMTGVLFLFWRRARKAGFWHKEQKLFTKPGSTFALMLIVYGCMRFPLEFVRDDNPYERWGLTVSQLIALGMILFGSALMLLVQWMRAEKPESPRPAQNESR